MKKVGIVGGLGPEATVDYYNTIISEFQEKIGTKERLPELYINSINMYKLFDLLGAGKTAEVTEYLTEAVQKLESIGADFVVMCGNTPHIVFEQIQQKVQVPMISIVEETCIEARQLGLIKLGLIGTKFTMENDFFQKPFAAQQMEIVMPNHLEQEYIHRKIVEELENGIANIETKEVFLDIINQMIKRDGIQGIILGCTELPLLIKNEDLNLHSLNTAKIHIRKIVETIFSDTSNSLKE